MNLLIDFICENVVMLFVLFIGLKLNLFELNNINLLMCFEVSQFVLDFKDMVKICNIEYYIGGKFMVYELDICYLVVWGKEGIEVCLVLLCVEVVDVVKLGYNILIVLDCVVDEKQVVILVLLVMFVIYYYLVDKGLCMSMGLVVEMGLVCEVYYFVLLVGYGVEVVYLYLVMEMLVELVLGLGLIVEKVIYNFIKVIGKGLYKVMFKMGILMYMLYIGVQIFEVIGLLCELVDKYFQGIVLNVGGIGIFEVVEEVLCLYCDVFGDVLVLVNMLDVGGEYVYCV